MYTIDTIPMTDYGLHISKQDGSVHLLEAKEQFFTIYGKQGYQVTKHKANELDLLGFIIANDLADFQTKTTALYNVFKGPGIRAVELEGSAIACYAKDGFTISRVHVFSNAVYAQFNIKLTIVDASYLPPEPLRVWTSVFNSVFGNNVIVPSSGIFNSVFNSKFN